MDKIFLILLGLCSCCYSTKDKLVPSLTSKYSIEKQEKLEKFARKLQRRKEVREGKKFSRYQIGKFEKVFPREEYADFWRQVEIYDKPGVDQKWLTCIWLRKWREKQKKINNETMKDPSLTILREAEFKNIPLPDEKSPDGKALSAKNGNFLSSTSLKQQELFDKIKNSQEKKYNFETFFASLNHNHIRALCKYAFETMNNKT